MRKQYYLDKVGDRISQLAIKQYSGDYVIMGKFGMIENIGSQASPYWDIWVTGVHLGKTLSTKRVNKVVSSIKSLATGIDTTFNNEATAHCLDENNISALAVLLGARKKMKLTESQLANLKR